MRGSRRVYRFSVAQREAMFQLKTREGLSGAEVAELLSTQGYGRIDPFQVRPDTVNRIVREMRERREPAANLDPNKPAEAVDAMTHELIRIAERQLERLRRREQDRRLDVRDLERFAKLLKTLRSDVAKVRVPTPPETNGDEPSGELDWLGPDEQSSPSPPTGDTSVSPPDTESATHEAQEDVTRSRAERRAREIVGLEEGRPS